MISVHVFISGQVQGVFFRAHTKEKAEELNLAGWVKNLPDGRVEAVFEGEQDQINKMLVWCYQGSPTSQVDQVDIRNEKPQSLKGFKIER